MLVIRILLFVFVLFLLLYLFNPQFECWVNEIQQQQPQQYYPQYKTMSDFLRDVHYNVPEHHRKPSQSIREFYQQREALLNEKLVKHFSEHKHFRQGGVILDGLSTFLPPFYEWKNGMVHFAVKTKKKMKDN